MKPPSRSVLDAGSVAELTLGVTAVTASAQVPAPERAKNIILLIGDGMGVTHIDAARERFYGAAGRLQMERQSSFGSVSTWAVQEGSDRPELVTDSASSPPPGPRA